MPIAMFIVLLGMFIFAASHTLFADRRFKSLVQARFGDRFYEGFYRLLYNIVAIITLAPLAVYIWMRGTVIWVVPDELDSIFMIIQGIGILGLVISLLQVDMGRFSGLSQAMAYFRGDPLPLPNEQLKTSGVYALVRHPLYFFSLLAIWPVTAMTDLVLAFNIAATLYFIVGSYFEEKRMIAIYGNEYRVYQQNVPWLLPIPR